MKKICFKFAVIAAVGVMMAAGSAAQDTIQGTFVEATEANTVSVADGSSPLAAGWMLGVAGGDVGPGFNHNLFPAEIVTTVGGLTPGDVYNIGMVYTNLSFFTDDNLAAGHVSGMLTDVPLDHADVVDGELDLLDAGSGTAYDLNIGPQTVNTDGELQLFVDDSSTSNFSGFFLAYKGITFDLVASPIIIGDVNMDGAVDFLDIAPFITVLSNAEFQIEADINEDTAVDFLDIAPFIGLLSS